MRDHGRRARDVTQQGDLAHSFAASVPAQEMPVMQDVELTRGDRIVGISRAALLDQDGAGGQAEWCEGRREAFDSGCGQFGEQRKRAQQRYLHNRHGGRGVQAEQGAAADRGRQRQQGCDSQQRAVRTLPAPPPRH
jgi:hypothetical protein